MSNEVGIRARRVAGEIGCDPRRTLPQRCPRPALGNRARDLSSPVMPELHDFEYVLERQPDGGYLIHVPELPGLATEGSTREEAIAMLRDALPAYLQSKRDRDQRRS